MKSAGKQSASEKTSEAQTTFLTYPDRIAGGYNVLAKVKPIFCQEITFAEMDMFAKRSAVSHRRNQ